MLFMVTVIQNAMTVRQFVGLTSEKYLPDIYFIAIFFANVFIRLNFFLTQIRGEKIVF